jgi:chitin disaccharide deacetylase
MNAKKLIVNADDLGMSEGINRGILEAHVEGIVTSTTAMMTASAATAGIKLVQQQAPALGLGLHFNLTYGRPLLKAKEVPSLVRSDGSFVSATRGLSFQHHWRSHDIKAELKAQFERFTNVAGCLPDHLDSHHLIDSLSAECREAMLDLADTYNLPVRQGGRSLYRQFEKKLAGWGKVQKAIAPLLFRRYPFKRHAHIFDRMPRSPDHFDFSFHDAQATTAQLHFILDALPDGVTELVCHPGYSSGAADGYLYRELELAALKDDGVKARIAELEIVLVTFASLGN